MFLRILFLITTIIAFSNAEYISYKDYKVYKIVPKTDKDVKVVVDLRKSNEHNFWTDKIEVGRDVRILVAPEKQDDFEKYVNSAEIEAKVVIDDVQAAIENQLRRPTNRNTNEYKWEYYQSLNEIYDWLREVARTHSNVVTLVNMGTSNEGRDILGVKIDFRKRDNATIGIIEGGIHAREWISPATVTWIINEFLTSTNPEIRALAENIVWHIFPVTNPDGYSYTFTDNRMWRKNRNTNHSTSCAQWNVNDDMSNGIDLNRNFGFLWMYTGASLIPCSEVFAGPEAFSEPEARAIRDYVFRTQREGNLVYYFAFHSFSQMVLVPYSHVSGMQVLEAANYADMYEIAIRGVDKLHARHGTDYLVGTSAEILYPVAGSSFDWVKGVPDVPIVYLFELRDVGEYGFLLPPELIIPNNEEIVDGLIEMDKVTRKLGYYQNSSNRLEINLFISIFVAFILYLF